MGRPIVSKGEIARWREHASRVSRSFNLNAARSAFVAEYVSRRIGEAERNHYETQTRRLRAVVGALKRGKTLVERNGAVE